VSDYINSFEELTQRRNLVEDPFITIGCFIRGLKTDLKREVSLFAPYTVDEVYHKTLEIEKLDKLYPVRCAPSSRPLVQAVPKMSESFVSASASKSRSSQTPPRVNPPSTVTPTTPRNPGNNIQCFSWCGRGDYASKCAHCTLAIEHESHAPLELRRRGCRPWGVLKNLVDVENSFLHDAHLGVVRCLLTNPIMSDEW